MKWIVLAAVGLAGFGCSAAPASEAREETAFEFESAPTENAEYDESGYPIIEDLPPDTSSIDETQPTKQPESDIRPDSAAQSGEFGTTQQALFGSDACRDVDIEVTNNRWRNGGSSEIEVKYVKYFSYDDGKWRQEDIKNQVVSYGTTVWRFWAIQDLNYARDDRLTYWRVYYRYRDQGTDQWSSTVYQTVVPAEHFNERCQRYWTYRLTVD